MKKTLYLLSAALILCWGCNNTLEQDIVQEPEQVISGPSAGEGTYEAVLTGGVESYPADTKGTFSNIDADSQLEFLWQAGDQIGVYIYSETLTNVPGSYGVEGQYGPWIGPFDLTSGAGTESASFSRTLASGAGETFGNVAIYPYTPGSSFNSGTNTLTFNLPAKYENLDNLDMVRMPMVAVLDMSDNGAHKSNFTLKHVGGAVKFTLRNVPAKAKYFKLWADGANISGSYSINLGNVGTGTLQGSGSANTVELQLKQGAAADELTVYFPVPAGTYTLGIGVYGDGIIYFEKQASKPNTIGRGQILAMPAVTIPAPNLGPYNENLAPANKQSGITYQMNVYSFADSDGDGIGDFPGIVEHLDYLDKLGVTAIWLSPSQLAQSYHGYDVKDYTLLNPLYAGGGTANHTSAAAETAFQNLIDEAHARNIRIYMDYVINHTGDQHPWFLDVKDKGTDSDYWNYYCISANPGDDIAHDRIPQIPSFVSNSYTGDWHPLLIGAGKTTTRYAIDLDWTDGDAPKITISEATGQTLTSELSPAPTYNNPARYLAWGSNTTQFADNGTNRYRLVIDYQSDWGCLVRSSTDWSPGTKWGFNGTYQLTLDSPYQLYASQNNDDIKNILMPDGTMYYYHSAFYTGMMPDINYGWSSECEQSDPFKAIVETTDKWMSMGLDGLRLDAVKHVYNTTEDNVLFWQKFYSAVNTQYAYYASNGHRTNLTGTQDANVFMVGEVLSGEGECRPYYGGLPAIFEFEFWWDLRDVLKGTKSKNDFVSGICDRFFYHRQVRSDAIATPKLSNHDEDRTASILYDREKIRLACCVLLTAPGRPFIYQGEELGYWGTSANGDEYRRAPILWTTDISSAAVGDATNHLGLEEKVDYSMLTPSISVATQAADSESLLTLYRRFAYARNTNAAMAYGIPFYDDKTTVNSGIMSWKIHTEDDSKWCLVMQNISSSAQTITRYDGEDLTHILVASDPIQINGRDVTMPPYSSVVFALN